VIHRSFNGTTAVKLDITDLNCGIYFIEVSDHHLNPPLRRKFVKAGL
jgi:hypothetical protein